MYINLPVNAIVILSNPRSGSSQAQETFLASSAIYILYIYILC